MLGVSFVRMRSTGSNTQRGIAAMVVAMSVAALLFAAGCSKPASQSTAPKGSTAKGGLSVAQSALSTMAPDGKLLVVQTAQAVTTTGTPIWAYLFGSPKSDKTFVVYVRDGKAMGASEYGKAGLTSKNEWAAVPSTSEWKVDSDEAYKKAAAAGVVKNPQEYGMGLVTYLPKSETTSTTKPFVWYVTLRSGTATGTVKIDAKTGETVK